MSDKPKKGQAGPYDPAQGDVPQNSIRPAESKGKENGKKESKPTKERLVRWLTPLDIASFVRPADYQIIGDGIIYRGGMAIVAGPAGAGKSRCITWLALAGALGIPWFGMKPHRRFKTMIIQAENDEVRLQEELKHIKWEDIQDHVRISAIPRYGLAIEEPEFQEQMRQDIEEFRPDVIVFDPWNRCVRDTFQKDYRTAIDSLFNMLPERLEHKPCILIGAHTRKPREAERANGKELLNLISGSLILGSAARVAMFLEQVSTDQTDRRVVFTVSKNNNGLGLPSTAWEVANGAFNALPDFDMDAFRSGSINGAGGHNEKVTERHIYELFDEGRQSFYRKDAVAKLVKITGCKDKAAYAALSSEGRFSHLIEQNNDKTLSLKCDISTLPGEG